MWQKSAFQNWLQVEGGGSARQQAQLHVIRLISSHVLNLLFFCSEASNERHTNNRRTQDMLANTDFQLSSLSYSVLEVHAILSPCLAIHCFAFQCICSACYDYTFLRKLAYRLCTSGVSFIRRNHLCVESTRNIYIIC